tara:strand:- start:7355 stop:9043 length:1689 start_codon:yes stop_codon:yes gene_type:complete
MSGQIVYSNIDTIKLGSYTVLYDKIKGSDNDPNEQCIYLRAYLEKARDEGNVEKIVQGYKNYLHRSHGETRLIYADSMLLVAKKAADVGLLGSAYLTKGIVYYNLKKYREALDLYLLADGYIIRSGDDYLKHKLKFNMALVKYYTERYDEAILLLNVCRSYFKDRSVHGYLNTLHLLGRCHSRMGNYGLSAQINKLGISEGKELGNTGMEVYFVQTEGINNVMNGNYELALTQLMKSLKTIRQQKDDFANEVLGEFYLGKSLWGLGEYKRAVGYFKKVDSSFIVRRFMKQEFLESYKYLSEHYASIKNQDLQLLYLNKHIEAINFMRSQENYLEDKLKNDYDLAIVQREKHRIERLLSAKNTWKNRWIVLGAFLFAISLWFLYKYYRTKTIYQQRFEEMMRENGPTKEEPKKIGSTVQRPDIPQESVDRVLDELSKFERKKGFLDRGLSANKLAVLMKMNSKYLSQVITYHKKKRSVTQYINDLRVEHFKDLLKHDRVVANFDNRSLAHLAGFNSERAFISAFKSRWRITPKFFVDSLKTERFSTDRPDGPLGQIEEDGLKL